MTDTTPRFLPPQDASEVVIATLDSGQKFIGWVSESREDIEIQALNDPLEIVVRAFPRSPNPQEPRAVGLEVFSPDFEIPGSAALTTVVKFEYYPQGTKIFGLYFQCRDQIGSEAIKIAVKKAYKEVPRQLNQAPAVTASGQVR